MGVFGARPRRPCAASPIVVTTTSGERGTMRAIQRHAAAQLPVTQENRTDDRGSKNVTWTPGLRWGRGHTNSRLSQAEGNHLPRERVVFEKDLSPRGVRVVARPRGAANCPIRPPQLIAPSRRGWPRLLDRGDQSRSRFL